MQYTNAISAYSEARFLVHFHLAIRANFEQGDDERTLLESQEFGLLEILADRVKNPPARRLS